MILLPERYPGLGLLLLLLLCTPLRASEGDPAVRVTTATAVTKTVAQSLSVFGVLDPDPDQVLSLSLPHAGIINRVWVRLGQRVKSGDPLLEVITAPDARMQFLQAQAAVDFAAEELARQQRLLDEQLATRSDVDGAGKNLADAKATLKALQQRGLDHTQETLRAPRDGIITQLDVAQGQRLQADTSAMLIAAQQKLVARLGVEAEDLALVKVGTPVTISSVFVPQLSIQTSIREVHAMINPSTHLVEVLAAIPTQPNQALVLGSRILGQIHVASHPAVVVPRAAVLRDADGSYLFTVKGKVATRVAVQPGVEEGDLLEVSGAIAAGDVVVASGNYELSDGMTVTEAH